MNIALYHDLPSGGAKRAVYELTRRLAASHRIDVFTLSTADHDFCDIRPFVQHHDSFEFHEHRLFHSPWGRLNQLQRERDLVSLQKVNHLIAAQINAGHYDVVFAHPCMFTSVPTILADIRIPTVYYLHEPFGEHCAFVVQRPYVQDRGLHAVLDHIDPLLYVYFHHLRARQLYHVRAASRLLTNSRHTQQCLMLDFGLHAEVCYLGVDTGDFCPMPQVAKDNHVLSVGELTPRKGFDFLIASLARIPPHTRPALHLACNAESPAERHYIETLAAENDVDLRLLGRLNTAQLAVEYNRARLCLYAPYAEPFGLVPLEAMACATPVVAVAESGMTETVVDGVTGHLVARDPDEFADAVVRLLDDPTLMAQYGEQAREHVLLHWSWESAAGRVERQLMASFTDNTSPFMSPRTVVPTKRSVD